MTNEEKREEAIQHVVQLLRIYPFKLEFKVKKNPKGVRIIWEMTQEQMDSMLLL